MTRIDRLGSRVEQDGRVYPASAKRRPSGFPRQRAHGVEPGAALKHQTAEAVPPTSARKRSGMASVSAEHQLQSHAICRLSVIDFTFDSAGQLRPALAMP